MAQWEDDLRAVAEHRGEALVEHARRLLAPSHGDDPDSAVALTTDALTAAFRRGRRRATGEHGSVRLVDDDELDALAALVRREQERLAPPRGDAPAPAPAVPEPDDGPSDALTAHLPAVVAHVREARRRGRRRGLVGSAAVVVVAALASTAFAAHPWERAPEPGPTTTPYAGACGTTLPRGGSLIPVRYDDTYSDGNTIVAGGTWNAAYTGGATLTGTELATLDTLTPEIVLTRDGTVVALGTDASQDLYQDDDGSVSTTTPWPGVGDLTDGADTDTEPTYFAVRFLGCDGRAVDPGTYQAHVFATTDDQKTHVVSDATDVRILAPSADADGYQPSWLAGSALACGEKIDDFLTRAGGRIYTGLEQDSSAVYDDGLEARLKNTRKRAVTTALPRKAALAWVQDGRIVGVGADERTTRTTTLRPGKSVAVAARPWDTRDHCASTTGTPDRLAPGTYHVLLYARVPAEDATQPDRWILNNWLQSDVVVHRDGTAELR